MKKNNLEEKELYMAPSLETIEMEMEGAIAQNSRPHKDLEEEDWG